VTRRLPLLAALALLAAACGGGASSAPVTPPPTAVELTIYGAASLKGVLEQVATAYAAAVPGTTITVSTDSSAALETQIEQGAPADVFLSADRKNPLKLIDGGFAEGRPAVFATNLLTIIVPTGNPGAVTSPKDLGRANVKVIAAGDEVPIARYATQLVANLGALPGYPADFAAAYASNVVSKEDSVTNVVAKIELGEGDAGIVYVTDAKASTKVERVDVPGEANVPATYAGVVVKASTHAAEAAAFLAWLLSPDGQAILAGFGFLPPG
jgi:molybdate transport system substrate-binding protein